MSERESFKQEALDSWETYRETGRHLTGQEVCDWLNTWGTKDEKAAPECHPLPLHPPSV